MRELFKTIAADPPWQEHGGGKSTRGCQRHYQTMDKKAIVKTMLEADGWRPDRSGCHCWLWATSNHLKDALWVMEVLGFEYKTSAVWVKVKRGDAKYDLDHPPVQPWPSLQIGLGQYMRHSHEWLLLGTMGNAMVPEPAERMPSVIFAPRTKHSAKPEEAYQLIESVSPGLRLEMFARNKDRPGWSFWGKEI